jgi:hypothetical protein
MEESRATVEQWKREVEMPAIEGTTDERDGHLVEAVVRSGRVAVHNLEAVERMQSIAEPRLSSLSGRRFRDRYVRRRGWMSIGETDDHDLFVERLGASLDAIGETLDVMNRLSTRIDVFEPHLMLRVDRDVPYRDLVRTLHTAGQSEFDSFQFHVSPPAHAERAEWLEIYTPKLCGPVPSPRPPHEVCIHVNIETTAEGMLTRLVRKERPVSSSPCLETAASKGGEASSSEGVGTSSRRWGDIAPRFDLDPTTLMNGVWAEIETMDEIEPNWSDRVLVSEKGACPSVSKGPNEAEALIRLLRRASDPIPLCRMASATATEDVRWRRIAPVVSVLQRETRISSVVLKTTVDSPTCSNPVEPGDIRR